MEVLRLILLFVHFLGLAAILGGFLTEMRGDRKITPTMIAGAIVLLVTGFVLVNIRIALDPDVNHIKFVVKLTITVAVLIAAWLGRRRQQAAFFYITGLLATINVAVAVFWT